MPKRKSRGYRPDQDNTPKRKKLIPKTDGQRDLIHEIESNDITFCTGVAGTGKTTVSVGLAVEYIRDREIDIEKILITRPIVESGRKIGYLPGTAEEKIHPYLRPVLDELDLYLGIQNRRKMQDEGLIEICPIELMRGRNFHNTFMILDEAQNAEYKQVKNFLTRIGWGSVAVLNGDQSQTDLPEHLAGGLTQALSRIERVGGIGSIYLDSSNVVRSNIVSKIVEFL